MSAHDEELTVAKRDWMNKPHEFRENVHDGECLCGISAIYHDEWERLQRNPVAVAELRQAEDTLGDATTLDLTDD